MTAGIGFNPGVLVSPPSGGSIFPPSSLPAYQWVWADGAARMAQAVTAAQVGGRGLQVDFGIVYELAAATGGIGAGGAWWTFVGPTGKSPIRGMRGIFNSASSFNVYGVAMALGGTFSLIAAPGAASSMAQRLPQSGVVTSAVPGTTVLIATAGGTQPDFNGLLYRFVFTTRALPASGKWWVGLALPAPSGNFDFAAMVNCFGVVRPGSGANIQFIRNDAAGLPTLVDLGAAFPAAPLVGYELLIRVPNNSLTPRLQLLNLSTGAVTTQAPVTEVPALTTPLHSSVYACNNLDAAACGIGVSSMDLYLDLAI